MKRFLSQLPRRWQSTLNSASNAASSETTSTAAAESSKSAAEAATNASRFSFYRKPQPASGTSASNNFSGKMGTKSVLMGIRTSLQQRQTARGGLNVIVEDGAVMSAYRRLREMTQEGKLRETERRYVRHMKAKHVRQMKSERIQEFKRKQDFREKLGIAMELMKGGHQ